MLASFLLTSCGLPFVIEMRNGLLRRLIELAASLLSASNSVGLLVRPDICVYSSLITLKESYIVTGVLSISGAISVVANSKVVDCFWFIIDAF